MVLQSCPVVFKVFQFGSKWLTNQSKDKHWQPRSFTASIASKLADSVLERGHCGSVMDSSCLRDNKKGTSCSWWGTSMQKVVVHL